MSRKSRLQSVMGGVTPALPDEAAEAIVAPKGFPAQEWCVHLHLHHPSCCAGPQLITKQIPKGDICGG